MVMQTWVYSYLEKSMHLLMIQTLPSALSFAELLHLNHVINVKIQ